VAKEIPKKVIPLRLSLKGNCSRPGAVKTAVKSKAKGYPIDASEIFHDAKT
jgi:hypothetical protein